MLAITSQKAISNLGMRDTEDLAEYLLYHMPTVLRRKLMAERPVLYARLYPTVTPETLAFRVSEVIHREQGTPVS